MALYAIDLILEDFEGNEVKLNIEDLSSFQFGVGVPYEGAMVAGPQYGYVEITQKNGVVTKYPRTGKNDSEMLDHIITYFKFTRNDTDLTASIFDLK